MSKAEVAIIGVICFIDGIFVGEAMMKNYKKKTS